MFLRFDRRKKDATWPSSPMPRKIKSRTGWPSEFFGATLANVHRRPFARRVPAESSPWMRWICASLIRSGANNNSCAVLKLLSASSGGTQRSSAQKKWTRPGEIFALLGLRDDGREKFQRDASAGKRDAMRSGRAVGRRDFVQPRAGGAREPVRRRWRRKLVQCFGWSFTNENACSISF